MRLFKLVGPNNDIFIVQAKSGAEAFVTWFGAAVDDGMYDYDEEENIESMIEVSPISEFGSDGDVWVM